MKTIEDVKRIEEKIAKGIPLEPSERMDGFSIIDGKVTDKHIHNIDNDDYSDIIESRKARKRVIL